MNSISKKKWIFIAAAAVTLSFSLIFYRVSSINMEKITISMNSLNAEIQKEKHNEDEISRYLYYKKQFGEKIGGIKTEPINMKAVFVSYNDLYKLGEIIDSTYHLNGFFFLSEFSLKRNGEGKTEGIQISILGSKTAVFLK